MGKAVLRAQSAPNKSPPLPTGTGGVMGEGKLAAYPHPPHLPIKEGTRHQIAKKFPSHHSQIEISYRSLPPYS